jgi:hypothetical protein
MPRRAVSSCIRFTVEILPQFGDNNAPLAWYEYRESGWKKHEVSPRS